MRRIVLLAALVAAAPLVEAQPQVLTVLSKTYTVDRKYKSMEGPQSSQQVTLLEGPAQLLWITGYEAVMVGPDGQTPTRQEFMCHSNLDFTDVTKHNSLFGAAKNISSRLFTLSQGQFTIDFPDGFGIPIRSDEPLNLTTQVLNHNVEGQTFEVRHKVTLRFMRDAELEAPMKPLFSSGAYGLALLSGDQSQAYFGVEKPTEQQHGSSCMLGNNASTHTYSDSFGRSFTGHWVVKPGREENKTLVTKLMNLPFDTTLHYIAVHLHPFAESLELRDLTTNQTLFKSQAHNFPDRIGLEHVDSFSSVEGLPVYKDHDYELVSVYNNTTSVDQDSMAVMYLYFLDKEYRKPDLSTPAS